MPFRRRFSSTLSILNGETKWVYNHFFGIALTCRQDYLFHPKVTPLLLIIEVSAGLMTFVERRSFTANRREYVAVRVAVYYIQHRFNFALIRVMFWGVDDNLYNAMENIQNSERLIQTAQERSSSIEDQTLLTEAITHL